MSPPTHYLYELRQGDQVLATGQLIHDQPLEPGDRITLARHHGIVRSILPPSAKIRRG